jgi:hypothetical protein
MDKPYNENTAVKVAREPVAQEIMQFASRLAEMSNDLSLRVQEKLSPVMLSERPSATGEALKQPREYPPLFEELRSRLHAIESSLHIIENAMSRTEL